MTSYTYSKNHLILMFFNIFKAYSLRILKKIFLPSWHLFKTKIKTLRVTYYFNFVWHQSRSLLLLLCWPVCTANNFLFMYSQKDLAKPHFKYQRNISLQNYNVLSEIIFCREAENYVDAASQRQHRELYISRWNYANKVVQWFIFQIRTNVMFPWICYFLF